MPITVNCACGKQYPVKEEFAGQRVKCPSCNQVLTIPGGNKSDPNANGHTKPSMSTGSVSTLSDFQLDEADEADGSAPMVRAPKKKGGTGKVFALLGCGCLVVVLGTATLAAGAGAWYMGALDGLIASISPSTDDDDPNKDKQPVDPNKDMQPVDPNKDKQPVDPNKDKRTETKPPPPAPSGPWKGHQAGIVALRFTNDHKYAVTAAGGMEEVSGRIVLAPDNSVRFWNVADGSTAKVFDTIFKEGIAVAAISPDGYYAAVVYSGHLKDGVWEKGSDNVIHVWDLRTKREMPSLRGHTKPIYCLAFKKNDAQLLSGGADHSVRLWNIRDGSQQQLFLGHTGTITGVAFDPKDYSRAVSCSADKTIRMWNLDADPGTNTLLYEFKGHQDIVWAVAFSPDGKYLLTGGGMQVGPMGKYVDGAKDTDIRLWDVTDIKNFREIKRFKSTSTNKAVTCLAFSADGRRILSGGYDNLVRLWYVSTGKELVNFPGHKDIVRGVAFFPDGKRALSGGDDKTLRVWNLPPDVPDIIANLASPDLKVKQQAIRDLAQFGDEAKPAVPALIKCLALGDAAFKHQVIALLKQLGGAPGREDALLLATMAADKTFPEGRLYALDALAMLGADAKPALKALQDMLKDNDLVLKRKAIVIIGQIGPDARNAVFTQFVEFLRDPDPATAKAASVALPKLGKPGKEQLAALGGFLTDTNENIRKFALTALADLGTDAEPELPRIMAMVRLDKAAELRKAALTTVLKLKPKDKLTLAAVVAALHDTDSGVCLQAVAALAELGPANGALPGLLQALDHKDDAVRKAAEEAFSRAAFDKTHVKALATVLRLNRSVQVRARVVDVLAKLGPDAADAAEDLGRVARDSAGDLRLKAIATLALLGPAGKKGAPLLLEVLADKNDKSEEVRIGVAIALTKMQAPEAKQALPLLIKGLYVRDPADARQVARQEKVAKILLAMGSPAADPLAKTLIPAGDFYNSKKDTEAGKAAAAARKRVLEILLAMGTKANKGAVLLNVTKVAKGDPDGEVRKLAQQVYKAIQ